MMLINEEDMNTRKKGKGSKGKRNKGKETLTKKSVSKKEDLIEKLELKGKKTIEVRKTIRIPVYYDVTKNKMDKLIRLTERITYGIRLIGELVSDVYADTFKNGDDNDIDNVLKLKTIEGLVKDSDMEEKTGLNSNFIQQCINKVIFSYKSHRKLHKEWEGKVERTEKRLESARDDKEREKSYKWLEKLRKREPSKPDFRKKTSCRFTHNIGTVEQAKDKGKFSLWIHISTLEKYKMIDIPLNPSSYHINELKNVVVNDFEIIKGGDSRKKKNKGKYYIHVSITKIIEEKSINSVGGIDQGLNKSIAAVLIPLNGDIPHEPRSAEQRAIRDLSREEQLTDSAKVELLEKYDTVVSQLQEAKKWEKLRSLRNKRENVSTYHDWCLTKKVTEFTKGSYLAIGNSKFRQTQFRGNGMPTLRKRIGKWTYGRQRKMISLKRAEMGYRTELRDEYGTSRECCECDSKLVRRVYNDGFSYLLCHSCGMKKDADLSAANVIATRCRDDMLKAGVSTVKNGVSL
jgi:putative transposase